ncbi:hypothetical protein Tco_1315893 [Tanacetum coccineum]
MFNRLSHRRKSVHERLSDTYSPSATKSGPSRTDSRDPSHSRGHSLSREHPRIKDRFRGVEESYGDTYSRGTRTKYRNQSRDEDRFRSVERWRESESPSSESSTSNGGNWKSRTKMRNLVDEDDLAVPWTCEDVDPFTLRIRNFKSSRRTGMPNNVKTYDGTRDPEDHLKIFQAAKVRAQTGEELGIRSRAKIRSTVQRLVGLEANWVRNVLRAIAYARIPALSHVQFYLIEADIDRGVGFRMMITLYSRKASIDGVTRGLHSGLNREHSFMQQQGKKYVQRSFGNSQHIRMAEQMFQALPPTRTDEQIGIQIFLTQSKPQSQSEEPKEESNSSPHPLWTVFQSDNLLLGNSLRFGMAIPDPLITEAIQQSSYYPKYLQMVAENTKKNTLRKCKRATCNKACYTQKVHKIPTTTPVKSIQPASLSDKETFQDVTFTKKYKGKALLSNCDEEIKLTRYDPDLNLAKKLSLEGSSKKGEEEGNDADLERAIKLSLDPVFLPQGRAPVGGVTIRDPVSQKTTSKLQ